MKNSILIACGLALTASALTLAAQDTAPGPRHAGGPNGPRPDRPHLLLQLDTNQDGALNIEELAGAPALLLKLDGNQDGQITRDEIRPAGRGPMHAQRPPKADASTDTEAAVVPPGHAARPMAPVLATIDADHDGTLSAAEIAAAPERLMTLDANQDGVLTREEVRPADRGAGQGRGAGFRGRGPRGPRGAGPGQDVSEPSAE